MPRPRTSPEAKKAAAVLRQQRYRAAGPIVSFDIAQAVVDRLQALRVRTGQTNAQIMMRALDLLEAELATAAPKPARRHAAPSPATKAAAVSAAAAKPSPVPEIEKPRQGDLNLLLEPVALTPRSRRKR